MGVTGIAREPNEVNAEYDNLLYIMHVTRATCFLNRDEFINRLNGYRTRRLFIYAVAITLSLKRHGANIE